MSAHHAALYGACLGLMAGIAISLLFNLDLADSVYRTAILTLCSAWMGMLLAWLNSLIPEPVHDSDDSKRPGDSRPS